MTKEQTGFEYDAYLSYNRRRDARLAEDIATGLSDRGLSVFFDVWRLTIGDSFSQTILRALEVSRYIIVIVSPSGFNSLWVEKELAAALTTRPSKILPVLVDEVAQPSFLRELDAFRVDSHDTHSLHQVIERIADVIEQNVSGTGKLRLRQSPIHEESETLPPLDHRGFLPEGIYRASLQEVKERFGSSSKQRRMLSRSLASLASRALRMGADSLIVGGSFVSGDLNPEDLDVLIVIPDQAAEKIRHKDLDVIQTYLSTGKSTFIASDKESVDRWTQFLENRLLSEPRGVVRIPLSDSQL